MEEEELSSRGEEEADIHSLHCSSCFSSSCPLASCPLLPCPLHCGARLHSCKLAEHLSEICPQQPVPCPSSSSGCPAVLPRHQQGRHLAHCPASLVYCSQAWDRWPLCLRGHHRRQFYRPGQLDYEMVLRDQRLEAQLDKVPRRVKVALRSIFSPRQPALPLPATGLAVAREAGDRGVRDKEYSVDSSGNVVDVVMRNYLRQQARLDTAWRKDLEAALSSVPLNTAATQLQREGVHNHCRSCVLTSCSLGAMFDPAQWRESCPVGPCPWHCGALFHLCKSQDHALLCPAYKPPDPSDWLRRLQVAGSQQPLEEVEVRQERREHTVRAVGREEGVPQLPHHLLEPAYLEVNAETTHPLQPSPLQLRTFVCGKMFRRDEVTAHLETVHQTIVPGIASGWLHTRCPLSWLGCSWACARRAPHSPDYRLVFSHEDDNFSYKQGQAALPYHGEDHLSGLPAEVLCCLLSWLPPIALRALALTCTRLREVCYSLLPSRGCVSLVWQRHRERGQRRHRARWVTSGLSWTFSSSMGDCPDWCEVGEGEVAHHLQHCSFYQVADSNRTVAAVPGLHKQLQERLAKKKQFSYA